jgi:hypothetical protein
LGLLGSVVVGFTALSSILVGFFLILSSLYMDIGLSEAPAQQGMSLNVLKVFGLVGMLIFFALGGLLGWAAFKGIHGSVETLNRYVPPPT